MFENKWKKMLDVGKKKTTREMLPLTFLFLTLSLTWPWISHDIISHKYAHLLMRFYWLLVRRDHVPLHSNYTLIAFNKHFFFKSSKLMHSTPKSTPHLKVLFIYIYSIWILSRILRFIFVKNALQMQGSINLQKTHDMTVH